MLSYYYSVYVHRRIPLIWANSLSRYQSEFLPSLSESILVEMKAPFCCKICCVYTCTQKEEHHRNEESDFMDERKRTVQTGMNGNEMRERGAKEEEKTFTCPDKTALAGHENPSGFLD